MMELLKENDQPSSALIRPYITKNVSPSAAPPMPKAPAPAPTKMDLEERVYQAVQSQVGGTVDPSLLRTIIQRVLKNIGGS